MSAAQNEDPTSASAVSQELAIEKLEAAPSPFSGTAAGGELLAWAGSLLKQVSPDLSDANCRRVVSDIHKKFAGDSEGLDLIVHWNGKAKCRRSEKELETLWAAQSATVSTVIKDIVTVEPQPKTIARAVANALDQYTVNGQLEEIERRAIAQKPILGKLALMGQATMFYAAPNTGKTLISFALAIDGIKAGLIDPAKLYYINSDDTTIGLAEKLRIAEEYGFKMLAEAYREFDARDLLRIFTDLIERDQARCIIVILDTATKVVNVLDAAKTRAFTQVIRQFVLMGGTVIALAHANKHPGADGKPVYRGTTDIINDFDCVYVLSQLQADEGEKIVVFDNRKRRGDVPQSVAYAYSNASSASYHELLASVHEVDALRLDEFRQIEPSKSDAEVIVAVSAAIRSGIQTKMLLADAVAARAGISKREAIKVIERYTGTDPAAHRWNFSVAERGAKVFQLLKAGPERTDPASSAS